MELTVNVKNAPNEIIRPYIVVRFCAGELWYYGQYDDVERANDVAEGLGMATVFDNLSYNAIEALEQEPMLDGIRAEIAGAIDYKEPAYKAQDNFEGGLQVALQIIDKYRKE